MSPDITAFKSKRLENAGNSKRVENFILAARQTGIVNLFGIPCIPDVIDLNNPVSLMGGKNTSLAIFVAANRVRENISGDYLQIKPEITFCIPDHQPFFRWSFQNPHSNMTFEEFSNIYRSSLVKSLEEIVNEQKIDSMPGILWLGDAFILEPESDFYASLPDFTRTSTYQYYLKRKKEEGSLGLSPEQEAYSRFLQYAFETNILNREISDGRLKGAMLITSLPTSRFPEFAYQIQPKFPVIGCLNDQEIRQTQEPNFNLNSISYEDKCNT